MLGFRWDIALEDVIVFNPWYVGLDPAW
jgi:hypothetical protein